MSLNITYPQIFLTQDPITTGNTLPWNDRAAEFTVVLCCAYFGNALFGLTGNVLVMWAIWPEVSKSLGLPIYVVNLLCAALLECFILPFGAVYLLHSSAVGPVGCHVLGLIPKLAQRAATMFTMWIFVVRYVAVSHPLNYSKFCKGWVFGLVSITLWLTALTVSVIEQTLSRGNASLCFPDFTFSPQWALPPLLISFLFSHLAFIHLCIFAFLISRSVKNSDTVPTEQCKRISSLLVFVVVMFGVFFCPVHIVQQSQNILMLLGQSTFQVQQKLHWLYEILFAFNSFSVIVAPFFYVVSSSSVNARLKGLITGR